jgi:uncharacterized membrane-anchored protein
MWKRVIYLLLVVLLSVVGCKLSDDGAAELHQFSISIHTGATIAILVGSIVCVVLYAKKKVKRQ